MIVDKVLKIVDNYARLCKSCFFVEITILIHNIFA